MNNIRLFLTSAGIRPELADDFLQLIGIKAHGLRAAFIPTAGNVEMDTSYLESSRQQLADLGLQLFDVDLERDDIAKIEEAEIIFVGGGNTYYLLHWMRKSGFADRIASWLEAGKIYVGESAGSIVAGPDISLAGWRPLDDVNGVQLTDLRGLTLTQIAVSPHYHPEIKEHVELLAKQKQTFAHPVYGLTDSQAVAIDGPLIHIVGPGKRTILT